MMAVRLMVEENFNMGVHEAIDGHISVDMFKKGFEKPCGCSNRAYKLIFMDMSMPVMGGLDASKAIFAMVKDSPELLTHIVILSAFTNQPVETQMAGFEFCISLSSRQPLSDCISSQ